MAGETTLYAANPDAEVVPASVTKLLTAAAALDTLGADTRLRTSVRASGPPVGGVVTGDLWLVGGGDPVLGTNAWASQMAGRASSYTSLDTLADRVGAAGVRRVPGRVVGDETRYDAVRYLDTWPERLVTDGEVGPLSALVVNDGFRVWGHPGVPFGDPPADAARLVTRLLADRGVTVTGRPAAGTAVAEAVDIAMTDSPPVAELVHAMLRDSDNGTAELLLKEIGFRTFGVGSTAAGARGVEDALRRGGVPMDGVSIADGSGLSDAARLTCRAVTGLLTRRSPDLYPRLPIAGRDGTLAPARRHRRCHTSEDRIPRRDGGAGRLRRREWRHTQLLSSTGCQKAHPHDASRTSWRGRSSRRLRRGAQFRHEAGGASRGRPRRSMRWWPRWIQTP